MDTEIELKYLVLNEDADSLIRQVLTNQNYHFQHQSKVLKNRYFDTPDFALRQFDIGLRIRENQHGDKEQTVKLAGQVVGGLHSRPEYNVNTQQNTPDLSLFEQNIWPEGFQSLAINERLVTLFSTDFHRSAFEVTDNNNNKIELVFDKGEIRSAGKSEAICEIELELLSGDVDGLFELAKVLFNHLTMRPGMLSKAARGYHLYKREAGLLSEPTEQDTKSAFVLSLNAEMSLSESFKHGMLQCLTHIQKRVQDCLDSPALDTVKDIADTLALSRHGLWLYRDYLPQQQLDLLKGEIKTILKELSWVETARQIRELTTKKGNYRKKIEKSEELLEKLKEQKHQLMDTGELSALFYSQRFNQLQLDMLTVSLNAEKTN